MAAGKENRFKSIVSELEMGRSRHEFFTTVEAKKTQPVEGSREEKNSKLAIMVDTPRFNHHSRPITTRFKIRASISSQSVVARTDHQFSRARECQIELHRWTINRARGRVIRYTFRRGRDSQVGKKLWGGGRTKWKRTTYKKKEWSEKHRVRGRSYEVQRSRGGRVLF